MKTHLLKKPFKKLLPPHLEFPALITSVFVLHFGSLVFVGFFPKASFSGLATGHLKFSHAEASGRERERKEGCSPMDKRVGH